MPSKPYRAMTKHEREVFDAFYGGVCCTLSAMSYLDDGTGTEYLEAVATVGARDLLNYATRERDIELPKIRKAVRWLERDERRSA